MGGRILGEDAGNGRDGAEFAILEGGLEARMGLDEGFTATMPKILYHGRLNKVKDWSTLKVGGVGHDQNGPGIYFTSSLKDARQYAYPNGYVYQVTLTPKKFMPTSGSANKISGVVKTLINKAPDLADTLTNWDENPTKAKWALINGALKSGEDNPNEAVQQVWYDCYRYHGTEWMQELVKLGYDGVMVDPAQFAAQHVVVWNPKIIHVVKEMPYAEAAKIEERDDSVRSAARQNLSNLAYGLGEFSNYAVSTQVARDAEKLLDNPSLATEMFKKYAKYETMGIVQGGPSRPKTASLDKRVMARSCRNLHSLRIKKDEADFSQRELLDESSANKLYKSAVQAFPKTQFRQHATQPITITKLHYIPMIGVKTLTIQASARNKDNEKTYSPQVFFKGVTFLERKEKGAVKVPMPKGEEEEYWIMPLSKKKLDIRLRCDCPDFRWRFNYYDHVDKSLYGPKAPKYKKKTNRPPVNPKKMPGMCKHCMKMLEVLEGQGLLQESAEGMFIIVEEA
jgi:hypothetical protein